MRARPLFSHKVPVTFGKATYDMLSQYANAARQPMTVVARGIIEDFTKRAAIGDGLPSRKSEKTPILQDLFEGLEEKLASTMTSQSESLYTIQTACTRIESIVKTLAKMALAQGQEKRE